MWLDDDVLGLADLVQGGDRCGWCGAHFDVIQQGAGQPHDSALFGAIAHTLRRAFILNGLVNEYHYAA